MKEYAELKELVLKYYLSPQYYCAEAVFKSLLEYFEISHTEEEISVASGFGGGMGAGCTCGTLTGSVLALGFIFRSQTIPTKKDSNGKVGTQAATRALAKVIHDYFKEQHKVTCCRVITHKYKNDKAARRLFCSSVNQEIVVFAAQVIEDFMENGASSKYLDL